MGTAEIDRIVGEIWPSDSPNIPSRHKNAGTASVYPESLLHNSANANKYYTYFQRYHRQFIDDASEGSIFQQSNSKLAALSKAKVEIRDESVHSGPEAFLMGQQSPLIPSLPTSASRNTASSLFSWSSGDTYIAARRMELKNRNSSAGSSSSEASTLPSITPKPAERRSNLTQRLLSTVEKESSMFIQDRINVIKAHHLEQASKKVNERRKRDHELHLRRIRLKEEAYEQALQAAIAFQNTRRNSGFFGSLFGPKQVSKSFTLDLIDSEFLSFDRPAGKPATEALAPALKPVIESPISESPVQSTSGSSTQSGIPDSPMSEHRTSAQPPAQTSAEPMSPSKPHSFQSSSPVEIQTPNGSIKSHDNRTPKSDLLSL